MRSHVTVTWGEPASYRIDLEEVQPMPHEQARHWLDEQFAHLAGEPLHSTGRLLAADQILGIAQAAGPSPFRDAAQGDWALAFARAASAALAKPLITVDVPARSLRY